MSNTCNCPGGNCPPGCINGQLNCMDPRCYPNCPNCNNKPSSSNWIIITVILVLLGVLLVMAFIVGFDLYKKGKKAAEPKNIIVNKHIHSVKQPIVISSPRVESVVVPSVPVVPVVPRVVSVPSVARVQRITAAPVTQRVTSPLVTERVTRTFSRIVPTTVPKTIPRTVSKSISIPTSAPVFESEAQHADNDMGADMNLENKFADDNVVSYDGFNLSLDDIPKENPISARETPCNSR